jgi:amino acid transporter
MLSLVWGAAWDLIIQWVRWAVLIALGFLTTEIFYYCLLRSVKIKGEDFIWTEGKSISIFVGGLISLLFSALGYFMMTEPDELLDILKWVVIVLAVIALIVGWFAMNRKWAVNILGEKKIKDSKDEVHEKGKKNDEKEEKYY